MDTNVEIEVETAKELTEKQKSILNLTREFKRNINTVLGEQTAQVDVTITVPEIKFQQWMSLTIVENEGLFIYIKDDSLPF